MHHGISALAVAIGPQRHRQIILILSIDDRNRQRRVVDVPGVATIAFIRNVPEQILAVFRGLRLLRRIECDDVVDILIAEIGDQARHQGVLARGAVGLDRLRQVLRILPGETWRCRIGTHAVRAMTSAAHGGLRLAYCRIAGQRRAALCRRLRSEIERHTFNIELAQLAQHGIHWRRCARAGQILLRRRHEIDRLLTGEVGCAGGLAVAVRAVAGRAGRRHRLAVLIRREDGYLCRRDRRQTGVVSGDRAGLVVTQVGRDRPQGGVDALAFLVFLQCGHDIAPALPCHIRNAGCGPLAVETVTALALLVRHDFACANVRRSLLLGRAFVRAADQRHRQEHGEQQVFHGRLRSLIRWHFSHYSVFTPRRDDE